VREARLRDLRLLLETRTIQSLDRRGHRSIVQKPTQISQIAQISQMVVRVACCDRVERGSDTVLFFPSRLRVFAVNAVSISCERLAAATACPTLNS